MAAHKSMVTDTDPNTIRTFHGAVAIVTGGASGIGRAIAEELCEQGARGLVLVDRDGSSMEEFASSLQSWTETKVYELDVRNYEDIQKVVKETKENFGRLDYMFNNAGLTISGCVEELGIQGFNENLDVNLRGVANGVFAAYPVMKEQGYGHLVQTASMAGLVPVGENFTAYGTSSYALVGLTMNLRIEAARHGVRVSALCPGYVQTPMLHNGGKYGKIPDNLSQESFNKFLEKFPPMDPVVFATKALKLVGKNKPTIVVPARPYKRYCLLHRFWPSLSLYLARKQNDKLLATLQKDNNDTETEQKGPERAEEGEHEESEEVEAGNEKE